MAAWRLFARVHFGVAFIALAVAFRVCAASDVCANPPCCAAPLDCVNPLIGTDERGGAMPCVGVPFASAMWVPMTRESCLGRVSFNHADTRLLGFASTRQMAIAMGEWGEFSFLPSVGEGLPPHDFATRGLPIDAAHYAPHVCRITAAGVTTEFTAREHSAIFRMTFPAGVSPRIVFDASRAFVPNYDFQQRDVFPGSVSLAADGRSFDAWNRDRNDFYRSRPAPHFRAFWHAEFSEPFVSFGIFSAEGAHDGFRGPETDDRCGARMAFAKTDKPRSILMRVGISLIGADEAKANLRRELPDWNFDAAVAHVRRRWEDKLATVEIATPCEDVRTVFYSSLYRALQFPREITENGRYYSAIDDRVHEGIGYTGFSLWDTYRAEHALLALVAPERVDGMMASLVDMRRQGGWLPLYPNPGDTACMCGAPAELVLAEAYLKGFRGFDVRAAYAAVTNNALCPTPVDAKVAWRDQQRWTGCSEGRGGLTTYAALGYVASDRTCQSVSRTQDFALADDACARFAAAMGDSASADFFARRAHSWTNLWQGAARLPLPRDSTGAWVDPAALVAKFGPYDGAYSECAPELARWAVPHDVGRLAELLGGRTAAVAALDEFCREAYAAGRWTTAHHNEPAHHVPYLYNALGEPGKCATLVRRILETQYRNRPDFGIIGQDDCGEMAAWYVLSALGFYPLNPPDCTYEIGSPIVDAATIRIAGPGKPSVFTIVARNQAKENVLVESVTLNGKPLVGRRLRHADLVAGEGRLEFLMARPKD